MKLDSVIGLESPSLAPVGGGMGPAFELKFLLQEAEAGAVEEWARTRLALDPHGDPALGGAYSTTSLYFDTPELDVFHRSADYRRRKFRVRRYGSEQWVYLERKSKWGDRVAKRRARIPDGETALLAHPMSLDTWPGHWFHLRVQARRLGPASRIGYLRTAYVGPSPAGPLRLTLDRRVHGTLSADWNTAACQGGLPLLSGLVILEFKFLLALPAVFKELIQELRLSPRSVSKYRLCREAWGMSASGREAANA